MNASTPTLCGLCLGLAAVLPTALADSVDIPQIDIPAVEIPSIEIPHIPIPAISIPRIQIPAVHVDLSELHTQLAALDIDLDDLDIDLEELNLQLEDIDLQLDELDLEAIENIAIEFENGWGANNDLPTLMRLLDIQNSHPAGGLPFDNPAISRQLAEWDSAIAQVQHALSLAPNDPQLLRLLERLYRQQSDYLQQLAKADPLAPAYY